MVIKKLQYWLKNKKILIRQIRYYLRMFYYWLSGDPNSCPHCNSTNVTLLCRKRYIVQRLLCNNCKLEYRYPKNREKFSSDLNYPFPVTNIKKEELNQLLRTKFFNSRYDFSPDIRIISKIIPKGKLLDYGASIGVAVYQFGEMGYDAIGFDIDIRRREYARKNLGVEVLTDFNKLKAMKNEFDVIFTAHTLEHISDISKIFDLFQSIIKPGGLLYIRVPNCTRTINTDLKLAWGARLPSVHALALTKDFFLHNLPKYGFNKPSIYSFDDGHYDEKLIANTWAASYIGELEKEELLTIALAKSKVEKNLNS